MDAIERRRHLRVDVNLYADWGRGPECEYYDGVTNLSVSGCFLATQRELRAGEVIHLKLPTEAAGVLRLKGTVRYQLRLMEGVPPAGAGVEFVEVSADDARVLQQVVNSYK